LDNHTIRQSPVEQPVLRASLNELDNWAFCSGKGGVVRCSTECLALLREFCVAALQFDPAASQIWVHGLSLDNFILDSTGRCRLQEATISGSGASGQLSPLRWLPPEYSGTGLATDYEKTVAYAIGVALLNVL
uniref:Protein kinase domain-containing protein n=2 Tax=Macrostomum lignano TaxID=282301 RepID=A0A1I8H7X7_9PLAT